MKKWMLLLLPLVMLPVEEVEANKAAKAQAAFDRMDREDFLDGIEEASRCTQAAHYSCADSALARIKELISDDGQQQLWQQASNDVRNARQREASLLAAQEEERRAEEREIKRRNDEAKQKMLMSVVGMAAIAANGRELGADNASRMMDAWNADVQRGDGTYSNSQALADNIRAENERQNAEARQRLVAQREREQRQEEQRLAASRERAQQLQQQQLMQQQQQQLAAAGPATTRVASTTTAGKPAANAEYAKQQALREQRIAEQEKAARLEAQRVMQPFVESSRAQQLQQQRPVATPTERAAATSVATAASRPQPEVEKKRDFGPAKAWCIANEKGTGFQCKGPLQNMWGFEKSLEVALNQVDCPNGTGYTPKPGQGGSSFDCGRRLNVTEQQMPLYDPFRGGGKPVVVRWEDCDPKAPSKSVRCY